MKNIGKSEEQLRLAVNEEINHLQGKLKEKDKLLETYKQSHGTLETLCRDLKTYIEPFKPITPIYKLKQNQGKSECVVAIQVNDIHFGEVTDPSEVEYYGEYNPKIARERCLSYIHRVIEWVETQRNAYIINQAVIIILGDLISGSIHEELQVTNAYPAPQQTVEVSYLLAEMMCLLSPFFKKIRIEFICEDNHSRLSIKPACKEAPINSYNFIVGHLTKACLSKYKNIEFNIYPMLEKVVEINGWRYLLMHGHSTKTMGGLPFVAIDKKVAREAIRRMSGPKEKTFHKIIMGHYHVPMIAQYFIVSGSVSGTNAFDNECSRYAPPSQNAFLVHKEHGDFGHVSFTL